MGTKRKAQKRDTEWLGTTEAAGVLGVTPPTVNAMVARKELGSTVIAGRPLFARKEVEALARDRQAAKASQTEAANVGAA